jgi:hypothetical protein
MAMQMASHEDAMKLVEGFVAQATAMNAADRAKVIRSLNTMTERASSPAGWIEPTYMRIAAERIAGLA